jgi:GT2 family glycosyltransferase
MREDVQGDRPPLFSVIVPHYRDLVRLDACLNALERQVYPAEDFEVIVSDNASPEGELAVSTTIAGRARLTITDQRGAGPARNGGVAAARGRILAFTDSDCLPEPEWLQEGVSALALHDFVGGRVNVLVAARARMTAVEAYESVFAFDNHAYVLKKGFTVTANLFCRRDVFDAVGGFAVGVSEDVEWSHRARAAGFRIGYAPNAVVGHPARRTWDELRAKWRRMNAEQFGLATSRRAGRWRWLARACLLPLSALAHTPKVLASGTRRPISERLGALATLYRLRFWRFADAMRLFAVGRAL